MPPPALRRLLLQSAGLAGRAAAAGQQRAFADAATQHVARHVEELLAARGASGSVTHRELLLPDGAARVKVDVLASTPLLAVLSDGRCGRCALRVDGEPTLSCLHLVEPGAAPLAVEAAQPADAVAAQPDALQRAVARALSDTAAQQPEAAPKLPPEVIAAAERRARMAPWGVLALMGAHFAVFYWGTYIEFSWDETEPLAFFSQLTVQILAYTYFLRHSLDFSNDAVHQRALRRHLAAALQRVKRAA